MLYILDEKIYFNIFFNKKFNIYLGKRNIINPSTTHFSKNSCSK